MITSIAYPSKLLVNGYFIFHYSNLKLTNFSENNSTLDCLQNISKRLRPNTNKSVKTMKMIGFGMFLIGKALLIAYLLSIIKVLNRFYRLKNAHLIRSNCRFLIQSVQNGDTLRAKTRYTN